jgi:hypothetical protein
MLVASILFFGRNFSLLCEKNEIEMCFHNVNFASLKKIKNQQFCEIEFFLIYIFLSISFSMENVISLIAHQKNSITKCITNLKFMDPLHCPSNN